MVAGVGIMHCSPVLIMQRRPACFRRAWPGEAAARLSDCSRWSQALSMEHRRAKKPRCSVTYLAGEEEALAKRKGKTSHTHKLHGCGLGDWLSLIDKTRDRTEAKLEESCSHWRNTTWRDKRKHRRKTEADFPTTYPTTGVLLFVP